MTHARSYGGMSAEGGLMALVRRAKLEDAKGIHEAHMRSIQEICSKDHTPEEIKAWGHKPYNEHQRHNAIRNNLVWVIEESGVIQGFAHAILKEAMGKKMGHIVGFYLTPEVQGRGFGVQTFQVMLDEMKLLRVDSLFLESSLTAHGFYKKLGFRDEGPQLKLYFGRVGVRCHPMVMDLK